jgi:hypothetical protein
MKAKYSHYGDDCIIYDQVICEDNMVVTIRSYVGCWFDTEPETMTKICYTQEDAKEFFNEICENFEKQHYDCEYKETK